MREFQPGKLMSGGLTVERVLGLAAVRQGPSENSIFCPLPEHFLGSAGLTCGGILISDSACFVPIRLTVAHFCRSGQ